MAFKFAKRKGYVVKKVNETKSFNINIVWGIVISIVVWIQLFPIIKLFPDLYHGSSNSDGKEVNQELHRSIVEEIYQKLHKQTSKPNSEANNQLQKFDPIYGFVLINGYRMDAIRFAAIGLGATALRNTRYFSACHWTSSNGSAIEGKIRVFYPGEHHDRKYETVIIHCTLPEIAKYRMGGKMYVSMEGRQMMAYEEKDDYKTIERIGKDLPYQVAYCSPPIHGMVETNRIREWLNFHSTLDFDYMVMYNAGGVGSELKEIFDPYVSEGLMEIVDVMSTIHYDTWMNGKVAFMNDCAYRMRHRAKWVMFMDFNEYWNSNHNKARIGDVLKNFIGHPYVTFGSLWWSIDYCNHDEDGKEKWAIERFVYRQPSFYCSNKDQYPLPELCLGSDGYRKYAVNPRMVASLQPHKVQFPSGGIDIDAKLSHINRYPGLLKQNAQLCKNLVKSDDKVDYWIRSWDISDLAKSVRLKAWKKA